MWYKHRLSTLAPRAMNYINEDQIFAELEELQKEHRSLDAVIAGLTGSTVDQLRLQRLKKEKLTLKDRIQRLESMLHPDLLA